MSKRYGILFCIIVAIQVMVMIYWGNQKSNYYWDEFYTFHNAAYLFQDTDEIGKHIDNYVRYGEWDSVNRLKMLFAVSGNIDKIDVRHILNVISVYPYAVMLNLVESLAFRGVMIKWAGIALNIGLFILVQFILFRLANGMFDNPIFAVLPVLLYGFSGMAVSMVVFVRNYMFLTLMLMVITWSLYKIWCEEKILKVLAYDVVIALCVVPSFKESPITAFYLIGLFGAVTIGWILDRQYRKLLSFSLPGVLVGGYILLFKTRYIREILMFASGKEIELTEADNYLIQRLFSINGEAINHRVRYAIDMVDWYLLGDKLIMLCWLVLVFGLLIVLGVFHRHNIEESRPCFCNLDTKRMLFNWRGKYFHILWATVIFFFVLAVMFGLEEIRYYSFVFPEVALCIVGVVVTSSKNISNNSIVAKRVVLSSMCIFILMGSVATQKIPRIENVYSQDKGIKEHVRSTGLVNVVQDRGNFVLQNAVEYALEEQKIYILNGCEYDYDSLPEEFLLWTDHEDNWSTGKLIEADYKVELFDRTWVADVFRCERTN